MSVDVFIGGGQVIQLVVGGQADFSLERARESLNKKLEGYDSIDNIKSALCMGRRVGDDKHVEDAVYIAELARWADCSDDDFIKTCIRKFRLFWPYSTAMRGLFFKIVNQCENLVRRTIGDQEAERLAEEYKLEKTQSSSPILYGITRDPIKETLVEKLNKLDFGDWEYPGFCPFDSTNRFKKLCKCPLIPLCVKYDAELEKIEPPPMDIVKDDDGVVERAERAEDVENEDAEDEDDIIAKAREPIEMAEIILNRVEKLQEKIKKWEKYYVDCTEQVGKIFQNIDLHSQEK